MQRIVVFFFFFLLSLRFQSSIMVTACASRYDGKLKVLTWNVQMLPRIGALFSESLRKMQNERTDWIIDYLGQNDYDVILLQECFDNKFIDAAQERLAKRYPYSILPLRPDWYKLSNGLMILSRYRLETIDQITFGRLSQSDLFTAKGAILAKITLDTQSLYIVNTHLQADYDEKKYHDIRREQMQSIQKDLIDPNIKPEDEKLLIAGDLNIEENIESTEYTALIKEFKWKDWVFDFFKKPSISFDAENSWNKSCHQSVRLDYFLSNFTSNVLNIKIEKPCKKHGNDLINLADHYGISAEFSL